jgi:hypothetical protein
MEGSGALMIVVTMGERVAQGARYWTQDLTGHPQEEWGSAASASSQAPDHSRAPARSRSRAEAGSQSSQARPVDALAYLVYTPIPGFALSVSNAEVLGAVLLYNLHQLE